MSADIIRAHMRNGELRLALVAAKSALEAAGEPELAELWTVYSRACSRMGDPRDALRAAEQAVLRTSDWEAALALGEAWIGLGEPWKARQVLDEALVRVREGRSAPVVGSAEEAVRAAVDRSAEAEIWLSIGLAEAMRGSGDAASGIGVATRATVLAEERFGRGSAWAEATYALGICLHGAGQEEAARRVLIECLDVRREADPRHPDVAATLDGLGMVERARNRPFEAVDRHREALDIWSDRIGPTSGPAGACRHALAQALHRTGDFAGARDEMTAAVAITAKCFGADHLDAHIARFELGRFEMDCGDPETGIRRMEDARATVRERLGRDHPVVKAMDRWL